MTNKKKIMIVDDHPLIREGVKDLISREPDLCICAEAADNHEALTQLDQQKPDLAIVDLSLANGNGLALIGQMKRRAKSIKILVLSMRDGHIYAKRALQAGAAGYVDKQSTTEELIGALRQVLAGGVYLVSERRAATPIPVYQVGHSDRPSIDALTDRELEVLSLIGGANTTEQIAKGLHLSTKTIETHRLNIKRKLGLDNTPALVRFAVAWEISQGHG